MFRKRTTKKNENQGNGKMEDIEEGWVEVQPEIEMESLLDLLPVEVKALIFEKLRSLKDLTSTMLVKEEFSSIVLNNTGITASVFKNALDDNPELSYSMRIKIKNTPTLIEKIQGKESYSRLSLGEYFIETKRYDLFEIVLAKLIEILKKDPNKYLINELLFKAISSQDDISINMLLQAGADPKHTNKNRAGYSPLTCAIASGNIHICQLLISQGADINESSAETKDYAQPMVIACITGNVEIVNYLINHDQVYDTINDAYLKKLNMAINQFFDKNQRIISKDFVPSRNTFHKSAAQKLFVNLIKLNKKQNTFFAIFTDFAQKLREKNTIIQNENIEKRAIFLDELCKFINKNKRLPPKEIMRKFLDEHSEFKNNLSQNVMESQAVTWKIFSSQEDVSDKKLRKLLADYTGDGRYLDYAFYVDKKNYGV